METPERMHVIIHTCPPCPHHISFCDLIVTMVRNPLVLGQNNGTWGGGQRDVKPTPLPTYRVPNLETPFIGTQLAIAIPSQALASCEFVDHCPTRVTGGNGFVRTETGSCVVRRGARSRTRVPCFRIIVSNGEELARQHVAQFAHLRASKPRRTRIYGLVCFTPEHLHCGPRCIRARRVL